MPSPGATHQWTVLSREVADIRAIRRQFKAWINEQMRSENPLVEYEVVFAELVTLVALRGSLPSCIEGNIHGGVLQLSVDDWNPPHLSDGTSDLRLIAMLATRVSTHVEPLGRRLLVVTMPILV